MAALSALGALVMVWGAWSTLDGAMRAEKIASPPDLKKVVAKVEDSTRRVAAQVSHDASEAYEGNRRLASEDTQDDQPVDQSFGNSVVHQ